jgi:hypothetical protein
MNIKIRKGCLTEEEITTLRAIMAKAEKNQQLK